MDATKHPITASGASQSTSDRGPPVAPARPVAVSEVPRIQSPEESAHLSEKPQTERLPTPSPSRALSFAKSPILRNPTKPTIPMSPMEKPNLPKKMVDEPTSSQKSICAQKKNLRSKKRKNLELGEDLSKTSATSLPPKRFACSKSTSAVGYLPDRVNMVQFQTDLHPKPIMSTNDTSPPRVSQSLPSLTFNQSRGGGRVDALAAANSLPVDPGAADYASPIAIAPLGATVHSSQTANPTDELANHPSSTSALNMPVGSNRRSMSTSWATVDDCSKQKKRRSDSESETNCPKSAKVESKASSDTRGKVMDDEKKTVDATKHPTTASGASQPTSDRGPPVAPARPVVIFEESRIVYQRSRIDPRIQFPEKSAHQKHEEMESGDEQIDDTPNEECLSSREKVGQADEDGDLPIHIAVVHENLAAVKKLLYMMKVASVSIDHYNNDKQTPLHLAVITKNAAILSSLLQAGSNPNLPDLKGCTGIHLAVKHNSRDCLLAILQESKIRPELNATNYDGYTALHMSVLERQGDLMEELLEAGADMDMPDGRSGRTALFHASETNHFNIAEMLLEKGAGVNIPCFGGTTPVQAAKGRGHLDLVALLFRRGADVPTEEDKGDMENQPSTSRSTHRGSLKKKKRKGTG